MLRPHFPLAPRRARTLDRFKRDETLEELIAAIERDIGANKPAAALDRLHTYCMKKFRIFWTSVASDGITTIRYKAALGNM